MLAIGRTARAVAWALVAAAIPTEASACACGCGVFDITHVFTDRPGGTVYFEYDFMDQDRNWHGLHQAPAADNDDRDIRTDFFTWGGEYLFANGIGVMAEVPFWSRHFETTESGALERFDHAALGDIRITAAYSGFSDDRGTGVTVGVKLPSGDFGYAGFDRDTAIGSGSTDLTVGLYRRGALDAFGTWRYFAQGRYETALATQGGYHPGNELNGIVGVSYDAGTVGSLALAPVLQFIGLLRRHDSGPAADPPNSGYSRLMVAPGIDAGFGAWIVHAEAQFPLYQNVVGNQLTAPVLFRASLGYVF